MNINKGTTTENLTQAIGLYIDQKQNSMRCATFALVTRVNTSTTDEYIAHTINALPLVQERINTKYDGKTYKSLPQIYNIPYVSSTNPQEGQYCVLIHLDRSIVGSVSVGEYEGQQYPIITSKKGSHRLSDCIAICGIQVDFLDSQMGQVTGRTVSKLTVNNYSKENALQEKIEQLEKRISELENILLNGGNNNNG